MNKCNKCVGGSMKKLCFDLEIRELLLNLIEDGINNQIDTANFLYKAEINNNIKRIISQGVRGHFDCMLPQRVE